MNTGPSSSPPNSSAAPTAGSAQPVEYANPSSVSGKERQIPKWVGFMVALAIVGSMLSGGGIWAYGYYNRPDPKNLVEVGGGSRTIIRSAPIVQQPSATPVIPGFAAIERVSTTTFRIRAGDFNGVATKPTNGDWRLSISYAKPDLLSADQRVAITARNRYASDPLFAKSSKVDQAQIDALKKLPSVSSTNPPITVVPADQEKLSQMWIAFMANKTPKAEDGQKIVTAVQDIGKASVATMRASLAETTKQVQTILTADQLAPFK